MAKKILALGVGILLAVFLVAGLELVFRFNRAHAFFRVPIQRYFLHPEVVSHEIQKIEEEARVQLSRSRLNHWSHPLLTNPTEETEISIDTGGDRFPTGPLDFRSGGRFKAIARLKSKPEAKIYDIEMSLNSEGYRTVPDSVTASNAKRSIVLMGCSFTFGEGLADQDSFPNQLALLLPTVEVINYGRPGYGAGEFLDEFRFENPRSQLRRNEIPLVIFTVIEDHPDRILCSLKYCGGLRKRRAEHTEYDIGPNGGVVAKGPFNRRFPWSQPRLVEGILKSELLKGLGFFGINRSEADLRKAAKVFAELRDQVLAKWGARRFVVAFYPLNTRPKLNQDFANSLRREEIEVIDFTRISLDRITGGRHELPADTHPAPPGAFIYSWLVERAIREQHWL